MNGLKIVFSKLEKYLVEGYFLRRCREEIDEWIGQIARFILLHTTEVRSNKIFFHTQENRYCCNPKYICEEFRKRKINVDMVWRVSNNKHGGVPEDVRTVIEGTLEYYKEIFSSKYIITNSVLYVKRGFSLKRNQVLIETWHGSLGIKRFGRYDYKGGWHWVNGAIHTGKMTSYCVTNGHFVSDALRETYWPHTPMLEYGHPRNDIMFDSYKEKRKQIRESFLKKYNLPKDMRFILYAPTFRDSKNFDCYDIDIPGLLTAAKEKFGGRWKLLLRYHSALRTVYRKRNQIFDADVIDVTDFDDMQELITLADIGITDYSSWIYDFMLQRRPGFIFATDIDLYNNERGFCYPLETTPFPIAVEKYQLNKNVSEFDEKQYLKKLEDFLLEKGCIEDGHASERVVNKILEEMQY